MIQPVVKPAEQSVEQPAASCVQAFNRLYLCVAFEENYIYISQLPVILYTGAHAISSLSLVMTNYPQIGVSGSRDPFLKFGDHVISLKLVKIGTSN